MRGLAVLIETPELRSILLRHAHRGLRIQLLLRAVLLVFMLAVIVFVPPAKDRAACYVLIAIYAVWALAVAVWTRRGGIGPVRWTWAVLLVDVAAVGALTLVAGASAEKTWTADVLVNGLFLIPVLAATQLRPVVCAAVVIPATAVYLASSLATKAANTEPLPSILLRTLVFAGLSAGCIALSWIQLSRVLTIAGLAVDRAELLANLVEVESRERERLADDLHDGALQYVLSARQDVDDVRDGDRQALDRVDEALAQTSAALRSTVSDLHPAVLRAAGLATSLRDLTARGRVPTRLDVSGWPDRPTIVDDLLFTTARELLTNVGKHAHASTAEVTLAQQDGQARLIVADDGTGLDEAALPSVVGAGHIGLASLRARVAGAGGTLSFARGNPNGTVVRVTLPLTA